MVRIFGRKPSEIRKDTVTVGAKIGLALAAVTAIVATVLVGVPQLGAILGALGGVTTAVNLFVGALQREDVASGIDGLDDILE